MRRLDVSPTSVMSGIIILIGIVILITVDTIPFYMGMLLVLVAAGIPYGIQAAGLWGGVPSVVLIVLAVASIVKRTTEGVGLILAVGVGLVIYNGMRKK